MRSYPDRPLAIVVGATDVGSATAVALHRAGYGVVLCEDVDPTWPRRGMAFTNAWYVGSAELDGIAAVFCASVRSLRLEHLDEGAADDLALLLGVGDAGESRKKEVRGVDGVDPDAEVPEGVDDLLALVGAHEAVVHQDRMDAVAERLAQQDRRHRGVDAAGERADDRARRRLLPDRVHLLLPEARPCVQSGETPQIRNRKFSRISTPWTVWRTSG